ncbi:MAG: hypothetical protein EHM93_03540 [Bacteroidales bacterium]|nr:MAG: hypothetical protein EHM93_03540 [Bacteroidales bacterium]
MKSTFLIIGGVMQLLLVFLHISIFFSIPQNPDLNANAKESAYIFNACVTITVMFFAYVSFFKRQELINSNIGRIVAFFIALYYITRGLVEVILRGINPLSLSVLIAIAVLYMVVLIPSKKKQV